MTEVFYVFAVCGFALLLLAIFFAYNLYRLKKNETKI